MVQKYVSTCLVLVFLGVATPAFAGDYVNPNLFSQRMPLSAAAFPALAGARFLPPSVALHSGLAFAPPQPGQTQPGQTPLVQPAKGSLTGKGQFFKWGGVVLMGVGAALVVRGASLSDPCKSYGPGYLCTSNYQQVRAVSLGLGGASAGTGLVMFLLHNRYRD